MCFQNVVASFTVSAATLAFVSGVFGYFIVRFSIAAGGGGSERLLVSSASTWISLLLVVILQFFPSYLPITSAGSRKSVSVPWLFITPYNHICKSWSWSVYPVSDCINIPCNSFGQINQKDCLATLLQRFCWLFHVVDHEIFNPVMSCKAKLNWLLWVVCWTIVKFYTPLKATL